MKMFLAIILCAVMLLPMLAYIPGLSLETKAAETAVYVRDGGTGDGSSADKPLGSLYDAYTVLGDQGGKIVICGTYTINSNFEEPVHNGQVTVTQNHNDLDYREGTALDVGTTYKRYILNGPTKFENINIRTTCTASVRGLFIICQYNPIEFGEGITCTGFDGSVVNSAVTLLGGMQYGLTPKKKNDGSSHIIVKSGQEILIAGLDRQMKNDNTRSSKIEVFGGEVKNLYAGNINGCKGANSEITISGGKFTGKVACEYGLSGKSKVVINGGDFSSCSVISGTAIDSEITVAESVEKVTSPLLSGFKIINTSKGTVVHKIPEEVFGTGSFTSSEGTALPYRIYYPDGYEQSNGKKYPIFVYFHGNGSRGTDNKTQIGSNHAIVSNVLNSGTDCVILAPQAPKTSMWVSHYPGGPNFDNTKAPESAHLRAAIELINKTMEDERIDRDRLYIAGGSNGAAACWSIIARNPRSVAAALPQAGTGATGGAHKIAEAFLYTPIWTFHGDADSTLSVEGTRGIVDAVSKLNGTLLKYTEYPGRNHDIWVTAANEPGVVEWMLSQKRTDTVPTLQNTLDPALLDGTTPSAPTPGTTPDTTPDTAPETTPNTAPNTAPDTTPGTTHDTQKATDSASEGNPDNAQNGNGNMVLIIAICAVVAVVAIIVIICVIKKKKA